MPQFVRKNIDVISSTSRPTSGDQYQIPLSSESSDLSSIGGPLTPANTLTTGFNPSLSAHLFENYTLLPKSADYSSQTFRTALEHCSPIHDHDLQLISSTDTNATFPLSPQSPLQTQVEEQDQQLQLTPFPQLPDGYASIGDEYRAGAVFTIIWAAKKTWKTVKKLLNIEPASPPGHRTPDELERQPLLPRDPADPERGDMTPIDWYRWLTSVPTIYYILGILLVLILLVIMLITGDPTLLYLLGRGVLCYVLGSGAAGALFGSDFCPLPAQESATSTR